MKLISKFHDYYDTVLTHGRDESIVYVRDRALSSTRMSEDVVPWLVKGQRNKHAGPRVAFITDVANDRQQRRNTPWMGPNTGVTDAGWRFDEAFVVVGGKPHAVWLRYGCTESLVESVGNLHGDPSLEALVVRMKEDRQSIRRSLLREPKVELRMHTRKDETERRYEEARVRFLAQNFTDLHISTGAPVLLLASDTTLLPPYYGPPVDFKLPRDHNVVLVRNPRLADLHFQRALDPHSCFQDISQFIGGVMPGRQMPMVELSDDDMVVKKGFDEKYGFRRRPAST